MASVESLEKSKNLKKTRDCPRGGLSRSVGMVLAFSIALGICFSRSFFFFFFESPTIITRML